MGQREQTITTPRGRGKKQGRREKRSSADKVFDGPTIITDAFSTLQRNDMIAQLYETMLYCAML